MMAGAPGMLIGLTAMAIGFVELAAALSLISTDDLEAIATIFESIADAGGDVSLGGLADDLDKMVSRIDDIRTLSEAISSMANETSDIGSKLRPISNLANSTAALTEEKIQLFERFATATGEIMHKTSIAGADNVEKAMNSIAEAVNKGNEASAKTSQRPIVLEMDKRVFAKAVIDVLEQNKRTLLGMRR
jgi:hypothetical protein